MGGVLSGSCNPRFGYEGTTCEGSIRVWVGGEVVQNLVGDVLCDHEKPCRDGDCLSSC